MEFVFYLTGGKFHSVFLRWQSIMLFDSSLSPLLHTFGSCVPTNNSNCRMFKNCYSGTKLFLLIWVWHFSKCCGRNIWSEWVIWCTEVHIKSISLHNLIWLIFYLYKAVAPSVLYKELLDNEKQNFQLINAAVSDLGGIPAMIHHADMSNTIPDEKVKMPSELV